MSGKYDAVTRLFVAVWPSDEARDYVRFADEFLAGSGLPGADQGRGSAYLAAGDYFYDAGELADARRALLRSLRLKPTRRGAGLLARTLARSVLP